MRIIPPGFAACIPFDPGIVLYCPGATRGGLGLEIELESSIGADFELLAVFERTEFPARGRYGRSLQPRPAQHKMVAIGTSL